MPYPTRAELDGRLKMLEQERQQLVHRLDGLEREIGKLKQELTKSVGFENKPERD